MGAQAAHGRIWRLSDWYPAYELGKLPNILVLVVRWTPLMIMYMIDLQLWFMLWTAAYGTVVRQRERWSHGLERVERLGAAPLPSATLALPTPGAHIIGHCVAKHAAQCLGLAQERMRGREGAARSQPLHIAHATKIMDSTTVIKMQWMSYENGRQRSNMPFVQKTYCRP